MATTVSYSASMRTRKTNSASNAKSSAASQEYYENTYNYVGIVHFAGMALSGKVITGISLRVVAAQAGYGTGHTKTVYVRKANYQSASQSGITGLGYCGDALGTFTGAFYGNTSTYTLSGDLLNNLAAYIAEGNNTICLYNPNPVKSSQGYSTNYLQWSECTITVTYEEAASKPSLCRAAAHLHERHMGLLPAVPCGHGNADSAGEWRHRCEQRKGGTVQPWRLLFRVAPQQRYGRTDLPCASLMR